MATIELNKAAKQPEADEEALIKCGTFWTSDHKHLTGNIYVLTLLPQFPDGTKKAALINVNSGRVFADQYFDRIRPPDQWHWCVRHSDLLDWISEYQLKQLPPNTKVGVL